MRESISVGLVLFLLLGFCGCVNTKETVKDSLNVHIEKLNKEFAEASDVFFSGNYNKAKNLFVEYNQEDTTRFNYESYAFLAECYHRLGMDESGKAVYMKVIEVLTAEQKGRIIPAESNRFPVNDIKSWYEGFPKFPDVLKKENGFVPYDVQPEPVGGMAAISKHVKHPSPGSHLNGTVFILALINESGKASECKVLKSLETSYDNAAIAAIKEVDFTQPKRKGRPFKTWVSIPVHFQ
jgi:TonB family protein